MDRYEGVERREGSKAELDDYKEEQMEGRIGKVGRRT